MLHTKFRGIGPPVPAKILSLFTIYVHRCHLGHATSIISTNFYFLVPESLHTKFVSKQPGGFREKPVLIFICKWHWAKVKKDTDLQYPLTFNNSVSCLHLRTFRSQAAILSEKSSFHFFL